MDAYFLSSDVNAVQSLEFVDGDLLSILDQFCGAPIADRWAPPRFRIIRGPHDPPEGMPSDFPGLATHVPVFSRRAANALGSVLMEHGELLALDCDEGDYLAYNVTRLVDAIDWERSALRTFANSHRIMSVQKLVLRQLGVGDYPIFKLLGCERRRPVVTDAFRSLVTAGRLTGFLFEPVLLS